MRQWPWKLLVGVFVASLLLGVTLAFVTGLPDVERVLPKVLPKWLGHSPGGRNTPAGPSERVVVEPQWTVVYMTTYRGCGDTVVETSAPPPEMIGLDLEELRQLYPEWTVAVFEKGRIQLTRSVDGLCPEMVRYRYVRLENNQINIYLGRPPRLMYKEFIAIDPKTLGTADRKRLEAGVIVEGDDGVAELLEGLGE